MMKLFNEEEGGRKQNASEAEKAFQSNYLSRNLMERPSEQISSPHNHPEGTHHKVQILSLPLRQFQ